MQRGVEGGDSEASEEQVDLGFEYSSDGGAVIKRSQWVDLSL